MKVKFHITNEKGIKKVKYVKKIEENINFSIPIELQHEKHHGPLFGKPIIKNGINSLKKENGFRNLTITLDETLKSIYLDEEDNFVFCEVYLEETTDDDQKGPSHNMHNEDERISLLEMVKELQEQVNRSTKFKLSEAEKKFNLEKFNGKGDVINWVEKFNAECICFGITDREKWEVMRMFLTESAAEWYLCMQKKGYLDWPSAIQSFKSVFEIKNWAAVRYAINFKYMNGSLIDFLLTKQRLLLEVELNMTQLSLINLMVISLPLYVQNKLKRADIVSVDILFAEVANLDIARMPFRPKLRQEPVNQEKKIAETSNAKHFKNQTESANKVLKTPCRICESLNFPNRFHPITVCRNKHVMKDEKKVNMHELAMNEDEVFQIMNINNNSNE